MSELSIPTFNLVATNLGDFTLSDYKGKNIVIYFYPKNNTPGCSIESRGFRNLFPEFEKNNTVIFGVSRDSLQSHEKFKNKLNLPFELITDSDEKLCNYFNILGEKKMFGKTFKGLIRSTFLINPDGKVVKEWRKVKIKGHAEDVLSSLTSAQNNTLLTD